MEARLETMNSMGWAYPASEEFLSWIDVELGF